MIIYDDLDRAAEAKMMLDRAVDNADEILPWTVKPWRLDMLMLRPLAAAALKDAAEAHLIVLAVHHQPGMAPWLMGWLERWAAGRQVQDAAVALWDGEIGHAPTAKAKPELSHFAERHGLSFIAANAETAQDGRASITRHRHEFEELESK
jgi:hypothetical protein